MPQVTRTYETDMADLAYQISRSDAFAEIRDHLVRGLLQDQDAQSELLELAQNGSCIVQGERGREAFRWALSEADTGRLTSILYRDFLGAE